MSGWKPDHATWKWDRITTADSGGWKSTTEQPEQVQLPNRSRTIEEYQIAVPATTKLVSRELTTTSDTATTIIEATMPDWLHHEYALYGAGRRPNKRNHSKVAQQAWELYAIHHGTLWNSQSIEVRANLSKSSTEILKRDNVWLCFPLPSDPLDKLPAKAEPKPDPISPTRPQEANSNLKHCLGEGDTNFQHLKPKGLPGYQSDVRADAEESGDLLCKYHRLQRPLQELAWRIPAKSFCSPTHLQQNSCEQDIRSRELFDNSRWHQEVQSN